MKVLQIGNVDWTTIISLAEGVHWEYSPIFNLEAKLNFLKQEEIARIMDENPFLEEVPQVSLYFDVLLLGGQIREATLEQLSNMVEAYAVFYEADFVAIEPQQKGFLQRKVARPVPQKESLQASWDFLYLNAFPGQYGAKLKIQDIVVNPGFKGNVTREGNVATSFDGDFGEEFQPLFTYRYNLSSFQMTLEIWQEFQLEGNVEIQMEIVSLYRGSWYAIKNERILTAQELVSPYFLEPDAEVGFYTVSVSAKGIGRAKFGACHWRYSRMGLGQFVLGGERHQDSKRQEIMTYFNPGDMQPPLMVYFSGYRQAEGFEGFGMMKSFGTPFMLVVDPRIDGGCFYSGTQELEQQVTEAIQKSLDYLNFSTSDLILTGISMGSFGALYYASRLNPYAVAVSKPFTDLGDVALQMKLKRPDEFETIGDLLRNITGGTDQQAIEELNQRFWQQLDASDFPTTQFAIGYMKHDDYDGNATRSLLENLVPKGVHIYTQGYDGRHNDNSRAVNGWMQKQIRHMLKERYGRG